MLRALLLACALSSSFAQTIDPDVLSGWTLHGAHGENCYEIVVGSRIRQRSTDFLCGSFDSILNMYAHTEQQLICPLHHPCLAIAR